jgi:hypothetical protein
LWPAVASTWLGTGSCRSPTVEVPVGSRSRSRSRSWVGTGTKSWGFALYDPATETYEPAVLPGGQEAFDAAVTAMLRPRKSPGSLAIATGLTSRSSEAERRRGDVY